MTPAGQVALVERVDDTWGEAGQVTLDARPTRVCTYRVQVYRAHTVQVYRVFRV